MEVVTHNNQIVCIDGLSLTKLADIDLFNLFGNLCIINGNIFAKQCNAFCLDLIGKDVILSGFEFSSSDLRIRCSEITINNSCFRNVKCWATKITIINCTINEIVCNYTNCAIEIENSTIMGVLCCPSTISIRNPKIFPPSIVVGYPFDSINKVEIESDSSVSLIIKSLSGYDKCVMCNRYLDCSKLKVEIPEVKGKMVFSVFHPQCINVNDCLNIKSIKSLLEESREYNKGLLKSEIVELCKKNGFSTTGTKAQLIDKLLKTTNWIKLSDF